MNDNAEPISLDLFNRVDDYTAAIRAGAVDDGMTLDENTSIYVFYQNFFLQFFDYLGKGPITGFNEDAKEQATRIRLSLTDPGKTPSAAVICQFEYFCDVCSDLAGGLYFASRDDYLTFHREYVPELLESIGTWATFKELNELAQRSARALDAYRTAAAHL
jgi:hypothetical protein